MTKIKIKDQFIALFFKNGYEAFLHFLHSFNHNLSRIKYIAFYLKACYKFHLFPENTNF